MVTQKNTIEKFTKFLEKVINHPKSLIAVRNDGSKKHLINLIKSDKVNSIYQVPDSGFFIKPKNEIIKQFLKGRYIAINVAKDMIDRRFQYNLSYKEYLKELLIWILWLDKKESDIKFVFIPHIYSDIEAINDLFKLLPDMLKREKVVISPYLQGEGSEDIFNIYKSSLFAVGNRFHTNVCSIALCTPTIALVTYDKLYDLYIELDLKDRIIRANKNKFSNILIDLTISTINNRDRIIQDYKKVNNRLKNEAIGFMKTLEELLDEKK